MRCNSWAILLILSFATLPALAADENAENTGGVEFSITVSWQAPKAINSCLYQGITKVACWLKQKTIKAVIEINIEENMVYTLKDDNHHIIAKQLITINSSLAKKYRRRLRSGWSLF